MSGLRVKMAAKYVESELKNGKHWKQGCLATMYVDLHHMKLFIQTT